MLHVHASKLQGDMLTITVLINNYTTTEDAAYTNQTPCGHYNQPPPDGITVLRLTSNTARLSTLHT